MKKVIRCEKCDAKFIPNYWRGWNFDCGRVFECEHCTHDDNLIFKSENYEFKAGDKVNSGKIIGLEEHYLTDDSMLVMTKAIEEGIYQMFTIQNYYRERIATWFPDKKI